jgi:hypothetical protein
VLKDRLFYFDKNRRMPEEEWLPQRMW